MNHHCHWPGCNREVPPKLWGCKTHWYALPVAIRRRILAAYVPGQEITKTPSAEYMAAAREAQEWILARTPYQAPPGGNARRILRSK